MYGRLCHEDLFVVPGAETGSVAGFPKSHLLPFNHGRSPVFSSSSQKQAKVQKFCAISSLSPHLGSLGCSWLCRQPTVRVSVAVGCGAARARWFLLPRSLKLCVPYPIQSFPQAILLGLYGCHLCFYYPCAYLPL